MNTDILNRFEIFNAEIAAMELLLDEKKQERIKWSQENRAEIKKLYPKLRKIYIIENHQKSLKDTYCLRNHRDDEIFYFRPTDLRFCPNNDFKYSWSEQYPTVKGDVLDCNLKLLDDGARVYINYLKELERPTTLNEMADGYTKIYVMIDKNTGFYKIGRSKNPLVREKTLQSEKPTIEMLHTYDGKIKYEKDLHTMFADKRVRGEWFDLSGTDIEKIKNFFTNIYENVA